MAEANRFQPRQYRRALRARRIPLLPGLALAAISREELAQAPVPPRPHQGCAAAGAGLITRNRAMRTCAHSRPVAGGVNVRRVREGAGDVRHGSGDAAVESADPFPSRGQGAPQQGGPAGPDGAGDVARPRHSPRHPSRTQHPAGCPDRQYPERSDYPEPLLRGPPDTGELDVQLLRPPGGSPPCTHGPRRGARQGAAFQWSGQAVDDGRHAVLGARGRLPPAHRPAGALFRRWYDAYVDVLARAHLRTASPALAKESVAPAAPRKP